MLAHTPAIARQLRLPVAAPVHEIPPRSLRADVAVILNVNLIECCAQHAGRE
jgi:hypothetical protein